MKVKAKILDYLFFQEGPGVRNTQYTTSSVKLLNVSNLVDGQIDLSNSDRYISEEEANGKYKHFLVDEGDLIIASSGIKVDYLDKKIGFIKKEHLPLCMNTSTIRFKVLDDNILNIKYFKYYLQSNDFKYQVSRSITGSAQLNYGPSHLKQMTFILYDLNKQKEIVKKLDKINSLIQKYRKVLDYLDTLIKARFVGMFGDPISNSKGWDKSTLKELADVRDGTHDSPEYVMEGYPFITSKNISNDRIDFSDVQYISTEDYKKFDERSHVDDGDILMPMIGTIGGAVIVKKDRDFSIKNVALIKFSDQSLVNNVFIKTLLNSYEMKKYFNILKTGGTQKFISLGVIRDLPIIKPSIELQKEYERFVQHIDKLKFEQ